MDTTGSMAKKVNIIITDSDNKTLAKFSSKTLTKLFSKLNQGTLVNVHFDEDKYQPAYVGNYEVKGIPDGETHDCPEGKHWDDAQNKCVDDVIEPPHQCPTGKHWDEASQQCIDDTTNPQTSYDSHKDSKLHDGQVRTITTEGDISPGGLGVECRASGNPHIQVNEDGTFSLIDDDLGRFYLYCLNFNATLKITMAFWNAVNQTASLKMRSRHNEGGDPTNRFGGYGFAVTTTKWDAKREDYHNVHTKTGSGDLPFTIKNQEYFTVEFTVKQEGGQVEQIATINGTEIMNKRDASPESYMVDEASFMKQSYLWVRQNVKQGTKAELRIKELTVTKL